ASSVELDSSVMPPLRTSTAVSVVDTAAARKSDAEGSGDELELPKEFFKDFSGVKIGKQVIEINPEVDMPAAEDALSEQADPPRDPSVTVGALKWGRRGKQPAKKTPQ
ncbi:MAG: hypothetical protein P8182_05805, partial [Deltaproteobacteria bacterium]